jgi:hypothetical protein
VFDQQPFHPRLVEADTNGGGFLLIANHLGQTSLNVRNACQSCKTIATGEQHASRPTAIWTHGG